MKQLLFFLYLICTLSACKEQTDVPDPEVGFITDSAYAGLLVNTDSFSVLGCCDYLTTKWDDSLAAKLVLIDDKSERIIPIPDSGKYKSYVVDAIQIRDAENNVLHEHKIENCCTLYYRIEGQFIYFNQPGTYIIHKKKGFADDVSWTRKYKANNPGTQTILGTGDFIVTRMGPTNSNFIHSLVRVY